MKINKKGMSSCNVVSYSISDKVHLQNTQYKFLSVMYIIYTHMCSVILHVLYLLQCLDFLFTFTQEHPIVMVENYL